MRNLIFTSVQREVIYYTVLSTAWSVLRPKQKPVQVLVKKKSTIISEGINTSVNLLKFGIFLSRSVFALDATALLDNDNDDHNVEKDKEDPGRLVSDGSKATAEEWGEGQGSSFLRSEVR